MEKCFLKFSPNVLLKIGKRSDLGQTSEGNDTCKLARNENNAMFQSELEAVPPFGREK